MLRLIFGAAVYLGHALRNEALGHKDFTCLQGQGQWMKALKSMKLVELSCQDQCEAESACIAFDWAKYGYHNDGCRLYAANKPRIGDPGEHERRYCVMTEKLQDGGMDEADQLCAWLNEVNTKSWHEVQSWKEVNDSDMVLSTYCQPKGEAWDSERWYWIYAETRKGHIRTGDWRRYQAVKVERATLASQLLKNKANIDVTLHPSWRSDQEELEESTRVMTINYESKQSIKLKADQDETMTFQPPSTA